MATAGHFFEHPVVLLAEDDALLRLAILAYLEDEGFEVIEAEDGAQAMAVVDSPRALHLLFTDIQMPHVDGVSLSHHARLRRPGIGILVTSGRAIPEALPAAARFVAKPYDQRQVAGALRELAHI
jgi:CheY-like chemotaxis protein